MVSENPRILQRNYVADSDTVITSDFGGAVANLTDGDVFNPWTSVGANSDAQAVTMIVSFAEIRTLDTVCLLGHNIKNINFEYWDGSVWQQWFGWTDLSTTPAGANLDLLMFVVDWSVAVVGTDQVRITMQSTQPSANTEKAIGELFMSNTLLILDGMNSYKVSPRQKTRMLTLGDGSIKQVVQFWAPNKTQKYEASIGLTQISKTTVDLLRSLKENGNDFTWFPEPAVYPRDIYQVLWASPMQQKYTSLYKGAGFDVQLDLKQI